MLIQVDSICFEKHTWGVYEFDVEKNLKERRGDGYNWSIVYIVGIEYYS